MKTAFVSTILGYPWGGADTLWTRAAEAARARGDALLISVSPAVAASPRIAALRAAGALIHERTPAARPASIAARLARKLGSLVRPRTDPIVAALDAFRPDLVIFSLGGTYDLLEHPAVADWLRNTRTKFRLIANWQQENPSLDDRGLAFTRELFAAADSLNFVSTRNLTATRRHLLTPLPQARVVHNPLRWQPTDIAPWPESAVARLATVSRLDEGKGIHLLLHALAEAAPDLGKWQLNVYGQGPQEPALRVTIAHLGLEQRVALRGYVRDLRAIWAENHLLCSPAIEEGVPMTIPEAMLCERPVFATCVGGAEDWLREGETGWLCPAPAVPPLTAGLRTVFATRDRWASFGRAAAAAARLHYRPDDFQQLLAR